MNIRRFATLILSSAFFLLISAAPSRAQSPGYVTNSNDTGMPDYGSFITSKIDSVNLANGALSIRIPFMSRKGRGVDYSAGYSYESKYWVVYQTQCPYPACENPTTTYNWSPNRNPGAWQLQTSNSTSVDWTEQTYTCTPSQWWLPPVQLLLRANFTATDNGLQQYQFPVRKLYVAYQYPGTSCGDQFAYVSQNDVAESDTGQFRLDITNDTLGSRSMVVKSISGNTPGSSDTNGNTCCGLDSQSWTTDSLGREVMRIRTNGNNTVQYYDYYDSNGSVQTITVTYETLTLATAFPTAYCSTDQTCLFANYYSTLQAVQSIALPNGQSYAFSYDDPNNPGHTNPFGEITQITLPSGGYIKYQWGTISQRDGGPLDPNYSVMLDARVLTQRTESPDGVHVNTWTYSYAPSTTSVTDPLGNVEIHSFGAGEFGKPVETDVVYYQGSSTPLKEVHTDWTTDNGPISLYQPQVNGDGSIYDPGLIALARSPKVIRTTTTLRDTGQVSKVESDYSDCYSYQVFTGGTSFNECRDIVTQKREYDWGSGAPGALLRYTTFGYLHDSNSNYLNAHIWDRVNFKAVYDGSSNLKAQTQYSYDSTGIGGTSGVPSHDYTNYSSSNSVRGNVTATSNWLSTTGAWLTTTNYYNDLGNLTQTTDPNGNSTNFGYTDNFSNASGANTQAYLTSVTLPAANGVNHIEGKQYLWYTGLVAAQCGENAPSPATCSSSYAPTQSSPVADYAKYTYDLLGRPVTVTHGDGGTTGFSYNDPVSPNSSNPVTMQVSSAIGNGSNLIKIAVIDGLGRVTQTQLNSDPQGTDYTDTSYDALGRVYSVSNPHRSGGSYTDGTTYSSYDALGRTTAVTEQDGSAVSTSYSGNCTTTTDEAGKSRKNCVDGLGRVTAVYEDPAGVNYLTSYTYDTLNNLIGVLQNGSHQRNFVYDSLSRLTSATNPESGTTTYTYDSDGNVLTRTDARSITTTYVTDNLNRLVEKSYSDGTPAAYFFYDQSAPWGFQLSNYVGRLTTFGTYSSGTWRTDEIYNYDSMGRITMRGQCSASNCTSDAYPVYSTFDFLGDQVSYTSPWTTFTQQFDAAARPTTLTSSFVDSQHPATLATVSQYYPTSQIQQLDFGNGLVEYNAIEPRLQNCQISLGTAAPSSPGCGGPTPPGNVQTFWYVYGNWGSTNSGNVTAWGAAGTETFNRSYNYDSLNRLSSMSSPSDWLGCTGLSWTYDAWGNRTAQTVTSGSCPSAFTASFSQNNNRMDNYTYDAAGNLLNDGSHTYTYDAENRIVTVDGGSTATYYYDADGNRVEKVAGGNLTDYVYDANDRVVAEANQTAWQIQYAYLGGRLIAHFNSVTTHFVHPDSLGSTRLTTGITASVTEWDDYLPFGDPYGPGYWQGLTHKYTGKELDAESNLYYFGARYASTIQGRFLSADEASFSSPLNPQSWNLYAYVNNNPLSFTDPTGHAPLSNPAYPQCEGVCPYQHAGDIDPFGAGGYEGSSGKPAIADNLATLQPSPFDLASNEQDPSQSPSTGNEVAQQQNQSEIVVTQSVYLPELSYPGLGRSESVDYSLANMDPKGNTSPLPGAADQPLELKETAKGDTKNATICQGQCKANGARLPDQWEIKEGNKGYSVTKRFYMGSGKDQRPVRVYDPQTKKAYDWQHVALTPKKFTVTYGNGKDPD